MLKILYLVSVSSVVVSSITLFQTVAIAQEYPDCFIINSAGKVSSLDRLCKRDESHNLRIVMKAHEYQQGFERGRRRLYKEAFEDLLKPSISILTLPKLILPALILELEQKTNREQLQIFRKLQIFIKLEENQKQLICF